MTAYKNLTQGNMGLQLISLALPLLIGNIFQQLYNTIDAIVIERYVGEAAFAALGIAGTVMNLFIFVLGGCCTGIAVIAASLYGKGDFKSLRQEIFLSAVFGAAFTLLLSVLGIFGTPFILKAIQTPASVSILVVKYLNIIFSGLLASFFYNFFAAILRAVGNTQTALLFLIISILTNGILALLFVAEFHMGVEGAALATVIAQSLSALLCFVYIRRKQPFLRVRREDMCFNGPLIIKTGQYAAISAMHQSSLYVGKLLVQGVVNTMGLAAIAAYTATTRIEGIAQAFGDSGAEAISIFVAQNTGAGNHRRAAEGFGKGLVMLVLLGLALSAVIYTEAKLFLNILVSASNTTTMAYGVSYLHALCLFYFLCFAGNAFVGYFRGSGHVNIPFIGTTMHISIRVVLAYLLFSSLGLDAVAYATGIGWVSIVLFQSIIFWRIRKGRGSDTANTDCIKQTVPNV